jgi:hypothetical protein
MPAPELPIELWIEVTKYLPRSQIRKLFPLNRALLSIALDEIYKEGCLVDGSDSERIRFLARIKYVER